MTEFERLIQQFAQDCASEWHLAVSEGLVKVRLLESAMALGWTVQEGAGANGQADFGRRTEDGYQWLRGRRRVSLRGGSADACIVEPFVAMFEIKARPDFGTKSQAQFQGMLEDVKRAASDRRIAFWFVFDEKTYRTYTGDKEERRGRLSSSNSWFAQHFLPHERVMNVVDEITEASFDETPMRLHFSAIRNARPPYQVLVAGYRADALFGSAEL